MARFPTEAITNTNVVAIQISPYLYILKRIIMLLDDLISRFLDRDCDYETYRSGLASIFLKKSPVGYKELVNLLTTSSVSTLKYCVYDEMLNAPFQLLVDCCPPPSVYNYIYIRLRKLGFRV